MDCYVQNIKGITENKVSIIIPCRDRNKDIVYSYPKECELIIVEGCEPPGRLRDFGVRFATSDYIAFIDSDAYPDKEWYNRAKIYMNLCNVFCGPGIIPSGSSIREKLTDLVYRCLPFSYRVMPRKMRLVKEFPTFNLVIRKELFNNVGGFDTDMITGEDTILCRKLEKIFYIPDLVVYHKRRPFGIKFFKQVAQYGKNRGILIASILPILPVAILVILLIYALFFIKGLYENFILAK